MDDRSPVIFDRQKTTDESLVKDEFQDGGNKTLEVIRDIDKLSREE